MAALGRDAELAQIDAWLGTPTDQVDAGQPEASQAAVTSALATSVLATSVLAIQGEPGIGKTTLWAEALQRARHRGWTILSCRPSRSDAGLSHAGLADLLRGVPDQALAGLPSPQRRPLLVALLREDAADVDLDPRAVGTGLTALLGVLADAGPLMLAVDDAQWLDLASARALHFAIRRAQGKPIRLITAVRTGADAGAAPGTVAALGSQQDGDVARLTLGPLTVAAIHQIIAAVLGASFGRPVLVKIHAAAGGNPFYALEIGREIQRLGVPPAGMPLPIPDDHRDLALLRLRRLPRATRHVLALVAAAARPSANDLDLRALMPAERAGLVRVGPEATVEFTHPLFGSALYSSLPEARRRAVHQHLATRAASLEERARHLALAASGPDEQTAATLDQAAAAAAARGAADLAVELKDLARQLTPPDDHASVVRRELELADRRYFAGDTVGARRDLERSASSLPPGEDRAQVLLELGSVLWTQCEGEEGQALMLQALSEAASAELRARIHSRISSMADDCDLAAEHGQAALALLDENADPLLYSFALHNLALWRLYAGRGADHEAVERGSRLQQEAAAWEVSTVPAFWARNLDDFAAARQHFEDLLRVFAERGDEASSCGVLAHLATIEAMTGHMERASELGAEALDLARQTGQVTYVLVALNARAQVCAQAGDLDEAVAAAQEILGQLAELPDETLEGMARAALGLAALSAGDLTEADRQLTRADEIETSHHSREPASSRFHADHAEAVIGLGHLDRAEALVQRMETRADALPRPWILAVSARSRGLLNIARGDSDAGLADFQRALDAHQKLEMPSELGRTLLAIGRLHRRRNERHRADTTLAESVRVFESAGARRWAAAASDELRQARARRGDPDRLTATERKVAQLAVAGLRNHEIASRLFLSPKTVEANLTRAYRKLGVRSRTEMARKMASATGSGEL